MKLNRRQMVLSLAAAPAFAFPTRRAQKRDLDAELSDLLANWPVPGASFICSRSNERPIILSEGSLCSTSRNAVTSRTRFRINSMSKAFTALAIAQQVDRGKTTWETPIKSILPTFSLKDSALEGLVTLADAAGHRAGLRKDLGFLCGISEEAGPLAQAASLNTVRPFRSGFTYGNTLYHVLGKCLEAVSGERFEDALTNQVLAPLGMRGATLRPFRDLLSKDRACLPPSFVGDGLITSKDALTFDETAHGHILGDDGALIKVPHFSWIVEPVAGVALYSDAVSYATWLNCILEQDNGLLSGSEWTALLAAGVAIEGDTSDLLARQGRWAEHAARGWMCGRYRSRRVVGHRGGGGGQSSMTILFPDDGVAFAILSNGDVQDGLFDGMQAALQSAADTFFSEQDQNWHAIAKKQSAAYRTAAKVDRAASVEALVATPAAGKLDGSYVHPHLPPFEVAESERGLMAQYKDYPPLALERQGSGGGFLGRYEFPGRRQDCAVRFRSDATGTWLDWFEDISDAASGPANLSFRKF
jgi:CubicO group peptidase (beta-lactamase class C family)